MAISEIFSKTYLLDPTPSRDSRFLVPFLVFFVLLVLLSVVMKFMKSGNREMARRQSMAFLAAGTIGLLYVFGRFEALPWLGSRVLLLADIAVLIVWIIINTIWSIKNISVMNRTNETEERYQKYLPKAKNYK